MVSYPPPNELLSIWNKLNYTYLDAPLTIGEANDRYYEQDGRIVQTRANWGLQFIKKLQPKTYQYREDDDEKDGTRYGLMAQDVKRVLDENGMTFKGLVEDRDENGEIIYGICYTEFIAPLIQSVKELDAKCEELKGRSEHLENRERDINERSEYLKNRSEYLEIHISTSVRTINATRTKIIHALKIHNNHTNISVIIT